MNIKTRIILTAVLPILLAAAAIAIRLISGGAMDKADSAVRSADSIYSSFARLELLVQEHTVQIDQRAGEQWARAYSDAGRAIENASGRLLEIDDKTSLELISKAYRNIGYLFDQYGNPAGGNRFPGRITTRIVQELQQALPEISAIQKRNRSALMSAVSRESLIALSLLTLSALLSLAAAVFLYNGISVPLARLIDGLEALGRGDTTFRLSMSRNDELGRMAAEFNRMAESRQRAESGLRDSEQQLRETFDSLNAPAVILDGNGAIVDCNSRLLEMTSRQRNEVTGRNWLDLFIPDNQPDRQKFSQMLSQGESVGETISEIVTKRSEERRVGKECRSRG